VILSHYEQIELVVLFVDVPGGLFGDMVGEELVSFDFQTELVHGLPDELGSVFLVGPVEKRAQLFHDVPVFLSEQKLFLPPLVVVHLAPPGHTGGQHSFLLVAETVVVLLHISLLVAVLLETDLDPVFQLKDHPEKDRVLGDEFAFHGESPD